MTAPHVMVGISGGVDSAVAALRLLERGYRVSGLFMKNWEDDDTESYCHSAQDYEDAKRVCAHLEIPLYAANFAADYRERVFARFLAELRAGRTPNPDVLCNREIKFKAFLERALALGAELIATGHYARVEAGPPVRLRRARDEHKDQTYFLYAAEPEALAKTLFPVGDATKAEVRAQARAAGLPNHARKDSTGICFIGERPFRAFLERYLPNQPGDIVDVDGARRGRHAGLMYYTLGQRHGLGIGGPGGAWYVAAKDTRQNRLVIAQGERHPALFARALEAADEHWLGAPPALPLRCEAKTRYRQTAAACRLGRDARGGLRVDFDSPQRAVTPGQSVVFYRGDECLGGAVITRALPDALGSSPPRAAAAAEAARARTTDFS